MPIIVFPDTGVNKLYINEDTGRNVILSGFANTAPHNALNGLQGGNIGEFYHLSANEYVNLTTGLVVRPSETGQFYPTSNPSGYITGFNSGDYSTISFSTGISGVLQNQISFLESHTGDYYLNTNPLGFITGVDLSSYATIGFTTGISGALENRIVNLELHSGEWSEAYSWGDHSQQGYVTGQVIRPSDTGLFYPSSNPSGYITGVDLSNYATISFTTGVSGQLQNQISALENNTGTYYLNSNPSGYVSLEDANNKFVNVTGVETISGVKTFADDVRLTRIKFNLAGITGATEQGDLYYNPTDDTLDLVHLNSTQQIGQELFVKVQAGENIDNGNPVYISGRQGNRPKVYKAKSDSHLTSVVAGLATEDISIGNVGSITTFGYVRQIKTNYSGTGDWGTTWDEGDYLYVSKDIAGQLTNILPSAPNHSDLVGQVGILGGNGVGSIFVNVVHHQTLEDLADINGELLTTDGQFPTWHQTEGYFDFDKNINNYLPLSGGSVSGDINFTDIGDGIIIKSPDSTMWKITINNFGALIASSL